MFIRESPVRIRVSTLTSLIAGFSKINARYIP
jgi:hypothetical protein